MTKLMIVDDSRMNLKLLDDALRAENFETVCCSSGEQALETIASELPELILLDVMMPGMSGLEVCEAKKPGGYEKYPHYYGLRTR